MIVNALLITKETFVFLEKTKSRYSVIIFLAKYIYKKVNIVNRYLFSFFMI